MRCACGYLREQHDVLGRCPLCRCGETPDAHEPYGDARACSCACGSPAGAHDLGKAMWEGAPCPGRRGSGGAWLLLRQGMFREPEPPAPLRDWFGLLLPMTDRELAERVTEVVPETEVVEQLPPQVAARPPAGPTEIAGAGGKKQATKLGRLARAAGWDVEPHYWRAGDGTEGCALRLAREPDLRMVLTWRRALGHVGERAGWVADVAYGWRVGGALPTKITHTDAEKLLGTC